MIDLTQKVLVTWNNYTKEWYESKGCKYTKIRDSIKDKYCIKNDIKLIRIPYWEGNHIKDILVQELKIA